MSKGRLIVIGGIVVTVVFAAILLLTKTQTTGMKSSKPMVVVSTFSLYEAASVVGGKTLDIVSIIPFGSDVHMFSPTPSQVAQISKATFFIYNGAGFETWAKSLESTLPQTVSTVDMSRHVVLLKEKEAYDPHYWLDIDNMIIMTQTLEKEFSKHFSKNAKLYHTNAARYIDNLKKLKVDYAKGLKECKNRTLISNHDAFGYLAHANTLENVSIIGLSSDEQPSAKIIAEVIARVKEHGIKTIFFEEMINDNVAQTIANETGAQAQSLQPLENISENELKSHQTYESIMRINLAKLTQAMECR